MPGPTRSCPLAVDRPEDVNRVREVLDRTGFDDRHIRDRLAADETVDLEFGPFHRPRVLWRTREGDPLATLIRLFLVGVPVPVEHFRRAVIPMDPSQWADLGLVELDDRSARRAVELLPTEGFVIAHDACLGDGRIERDHVMGVTRSTHTFARSMIAAPADRTLDLGTGCGYLALLAAARSRYVLATDVNPRAVAMARFNAMLNRIDNVECAEGNLFEPAGDLRFDLIVSNPPFVISPRQSLVYRDSGLPGDAICERILRSAPGHLANGGFAQVICNWVRVAGQDWLERLTHWFEGSGCDIWIIHSASTEPGDYAQNWLLQSEYGSAPDRFADEFARWMDHYDRLRIEAIDFGMIILRRRSAEQNWIRVDTDRPPNHCLGASFLAGFVGRDLLDRSGDGRALDDVSFVCRPELRVSQRLRPTDSGWSVDAAYCVLGEGPRFDGEFTPTVFHLLTLCRGHLPLAAVIAQVASRLGRDVDEVREECLTIVRSLIVQGFLCPADVFPEPGKIAPASKRR